MKSSSNVVTDFGFGDDVFFGKDIGRFYGNYYGDHVMYPENNPEIVTTMATAKFSADIIVPRAFFDLLPIDLFPDPASPQNNQHWDNSRNDPLYSSPTLALYIETIESRKADPAPVKEFKKVYIGAPTREILRSRFDLASGEAVKYLPDNASSPPFNGLMTKSGYFQNPARGLICDGDLYIDGTLYLKNVVIRTIQGCRIYVTGPVFSDGPISFENFNAEKLGEDLTNLQITSARAVFMGIGSTHCETAQEPGYYYNRSIASPPVITNPLNYRTGPHYNAVVRNANPALAGHYPQTSSDWREELLYIKSEALKISDLQDASCVDGTKNGRGIAFERLLLNAPNVQSRYTGRFSGSVISEVTLFALSKFDFAFDPVFQKVPVLPKLRHGEYFETVK
jgi:hypothetical protein